jgi:ABC-type transporter Mla maintaining outer membrane lipid asymmetry ATPase subunit MlaF
MKQVAITVQEHRALVKLEQLVRRMTKNLDRAAVLDHAKKYPVSIGPGMNETAALKRDLLETLARLDKSREQRSN